MTRRHRRPKLMDFARQPFWYYATAWEYFRHVEWNQLMIGQYQ